MESPQATTMELGGLDPTGKARAHDPVIAKDGRNYYVYTTGPGIAVQSSPDMKQWKPEPRVLDPAPAWTATTIPGSRDFYWAPDISFFNGKWHLYYSVSTFGKNRSAIGFATNETLDPSKPNYKWEDQGPCFQSYAADNYNAIDPNIVLDDHKQPWLSFGSFWSGIQIIKLDPNTGKPADPSAKPLRIAGRPHEPGQPGAIEAPFIFRHGRDYYLFASFDFCCRGVSSTYNVRVGRARQVEGPYLDRDGKAMADGGGTLVVAGEGRWHGTGHNAVFRDKRKDYIVYHAYDGEDNGAPKLRIEPLAWDREGWPKVVRP